MFISLLQIPIDLHDKEFLPILQEEPLPPLALVSFTEEEQVGEFVIVSGHYLGEKWSETVSDLSGQLTSYCHFLEYKVHSEHIQTLSLFTHFVILQPYGTIV